MKMNPSSSHTAAAITIFRGGETTSGASMEATGGAFSGRRRRGGQRIMAKPIKELKKENNFLKGKTEKSDITLIQLLEEVKLKPSFFFLGYLPDKFYLQGSNTLGLSVFSFVFLPLTALTTHSFFFSDSRTLEGNITEL
ncbi:hypothetical protein L1887_33771 [Cichorium endivia]|nr:hypothetical protein L1887_33771 [Cichorium endivia]